jgi:hypothetical protein
METNRACCCEDVGGQRREHASRHFSAVGVRSATLRFRKIDRLRHLFRARNSVGIQRLNADGVIATLVSNPGGPAKQAERLIKDELPTEAMVAFQPARFESLRSHAKA